MLRPDGDDITGEKERDRFLEALFRSETPRLIRFFRRHIGHYDDAVDLAQEAFLRFVRIVPRTVIDTPEAYLQRIASNLLRDRAARASTRLERLQVPLDEGREKPTDIDQHRELEARQMLEHYEKVLLRLKPKTLEIFLLHRAEHLTYKQIGERLGMSEGGVKRHMIKAIAHIDRARRLG